MKNNILFSISIDDLQTEALERIGRTLSEDEIILAKKGLESGLLSGIAFVYNAIFCELIEQKQ